MDIYFCDSCAARVSDTDLHRGQGIKRGDIVICGQCIEKGLGKDLLAQAGAPAAPSASAPPVSTQSHPSSDSLADYPEQELIAPAGAPLVDRDGADAPARADAPADLDETDMVQARDKAVASDDLSSAASGFAALHGSPDEEEDDVQELMDVAGYEVKDDEPSTGIHPDPLRARNVTDPDDDRHATGDEADELAQLTAPEEDESEEDGEWEEDDDDQDEEDNDQEEDLEDVDDDDDDYQEDDDDYDDDDWDDDDDPDQEKSQAGVETMAFGPNDFPDAGQSSATEQADQPGVVKKSRRRGKKRRRLAGAPGGKAAGGKKKGGSDDKLRVKAKGGGKASSAKAPARSNGSSRRATAKGAQGGSSRRVPAKKKNNLMLILLSIGSALLISIMILLFVVPAVSSRSGGSERVQSDLERVSVKVRRAHDLSISAQRSDDLAELQAALRAFEAARDAVVALEDNLPEGWTEDDYHNQVRRVWRFHDLTSQSVNLRNRIGVLQRRNN